MTLCGPGAGSQKVMQLPPHSLEHLLPTVLRGTRVSVLVNSPTGGQTSPEKGPSWKWILSPQAIQPHPSESSQLSRKHGAVTGQSCGALSGLLTQRLHKNHKRAVALHQEV